MPKVSVIMPVYNTKEEYLKEAIESVLNQTFTDFEFLIVDDCSTNNTVDVIRSYNDERIRLLSMDKNSGQADAANRAWDEARGEFIARLDSDDIALPSRFETQLNYLEGNPNIALAGSFIEYFSSSKRVISYPLTNDEIKIAMLRENVIAQPAIMYRKSAFKNMRYDDNYRNSEDYELWMRALAQGLEFANIPEVLLRYRIHKSQAGSKHTKVQVENALKARRKFMKEFDPTLSERELDIFINVMSKRKKLTMASADEIQKLLKKLVKRNTKTKFFNSRYFIQNIADISNELTCPKIRILSLRLLGGTKYNLYFAHKKSLTWDWL